MIDAPSLLIHFLTHPFSALLPTEFPNALPALTQTSARQMIRDSKGSCNNNCTLLVRCDQNAGILFSVLST
jgi:hypothetical protein